MKWIPYQKVVIESPLPVEEVLKIIGENTSKKPLFYELLKPAIKTYFLGKVYQSGFRICRKIEGDSGFLPLIIGRYSSKNQMTNILLTFRPGIFVSLFMLAWFAFWSAICMAFAYGLWWHLKNPLGLLALGFPMLAHRICMFGFVPEKNKAIKELCRLTQGKITG